MSGADGGVDPARLVIEALRLDRWSANEVELRARSAISAGVGGFALFGGEARVVERLCRELRAAAGRPIWLAADLERGAGQQFAGCSQLPPPAALSNHPDAHLAVRLAGAITGSEARVLGLNWVLAPVLDLDVEPDNPIVATRSFGSDAEGVAALGRTWIEACQAEGVAACAKHFPGHGRTRADSHMELPVVDAPAAQITDDLAPFRGVADLVISIMPGHVAYPTLGESRPATRSHAIVTELLRGEIGFGGLVVTDAMIMGGFGADAARGAVESILAGCDLLLYPHDVEETVRALTDGAERDPALEARLRESVARSQAFLAPLEGGDATRRAATRATAQYASDEATLLELATRTILDRTGESLCGWDRHREAEVWIAIDDPASPGAPPIDEFGATFVHELRRAGWNVGATTRYKETRAVRDWSPTRGEAGPAAAGSRPAQRIVLLQATPRGWKGRSGLGPHVAAAVGDALGSADLALLILFGHPRILEQLGAAGACAWATEPVMERAAARWLHGAVSGRSGP